MKIKCGKLFIKENCISPIVYDDSDYYRFVKNYSEQGYYQVILSSTIMIDLLQNYFVERKFEIVGIDFMEEDEVLKNEIDILIRQIGESREKFCYLIEKLKFLNEDSSIEVKKLELKHLDRLGSTFLYLQVNGLYGIYIKHYDTEENYIKDIVERNLR